MNATFMIELSILFAVDIRKRETKSKETKDTDVISYDFNRGFESALTAAFEETIGECPQFKSGIFVNLP